MNPYTVVKAAGVVVLTFVFWHFLQIWGILAGCGLAMIVLP